MLLRDGEEDSPIGWRDGCSADVDLNRNFPDPLELGADSLAATGREQPETLAVMEWSQSLQFVASASMHEVRTSSAKPAQCSSEFLLTTESNP